MAPVDPTDLLKAFKPLLTVLGGIKSMSDVPRLSSLMKRYSKKLVSRCIYCNILLSTTPDVLQSFLEQDGWNLINAWLKESLNGNNYPFLCELLDLLDKCPMTVERLKKNDTPKLVKNLAKSSEKEVSDKAKIVVTKWTGLIKANENINNGNLARKKRKKEKSIDDEDSGDSTKLRKVKGGGVLQQQASINDVTVTNSSPGDASNKPTSTTAPKSADDATSNDGVNSTVKGEPRPRTAKISFGKSRGLGLLEDTLASSAKSKGANKKGEEPHSTTDKSGPSKITKSSSKSSDNSVPVSSSGQPAKSSKTVHTLKESGGFIEDIVSLSSTGQVRKRRKSDAKSKVSTSGSNTAKDINQVESSNNGDETNQEPMDTEDLSDDMDDDRAASAASGDDSNSNAGNNNNNININNNNNLNSNNNNDDGNILPIVDVPEVDNLVIPEIDASKLPGVITKSILSYGRQSGKPKKTVKWKTEDKLKEIKFFELDETERTNVSKVIGDYRSIDMKNERQMLQQMRNKGNAVVAGPSGLTPGIPGLPTAEKAVSYLPWKLIIIELPAGLPLIEPGSQSEERRIHAEATRNSLNSDFFPTNPGAIPEYYPKEPDLLEPSSTNDGPRTIPLEDENFTVTDYSQLPPPQPRTGESYPANRGLVTGGPVAVQTPFTPGVPGIAGPPRPPVGVVPRVPYPPAGFVPPAAGYSPYPYNPPTTPIPPNSVRHPAARPVPPAGFQPPGPWPPRPRGPQICRNFLRTGNCRFMARCNYLHHYPNQNNPHGPSGHMD